MTPRRWRALALALALGGSFTAALLWSSAATPAPPPGPPAGRITVLVGCNHLTHRAFRLRLSTTSMSVAYDPRSCR